FVPSISGASSPASSSLRGRQNVAVNTRCSRQNINIVPFQTLVSLAFGTPPSCRPPLPPGVVFGTVAVRASFCDEGSGEVGTLALDVDLNLKKLKFVLLLA
ncbi:unnamed protein product, partial [Ectocarpus sp. 13 AM-2016]